MGVEQAQRMAGHDDEGLLVGEVFEVFLDEAVLHPVLADLAGLAVGHELIGIERYVKIQVVVDHDLNGAALDTFALVLVNGLAGKLALRAEAVAVDPAALLQLLRKFLSHLGVVIRVDVAQGVLDRQRLVSGGELGFPAGRAAVAGIHFRIRRELIVELDGHGVL